jgi:hypothetical protein
MAPFATAFGRGATERLVIAATPDGTVRDVTAGVASAVTVQ